MGKNPRIVALKMNPESKKPSPEMPEGDEQFRLLVMSHKEPDEWKAGPQDAPMIGDATFRQMIGPCTKEPDQKLQARSLARSCRPQWLARSASQPTEGKCSCGRRP